MKTFIHLVPVPHHAGRFFSPCAPNGAGIILFPEGLGYTWWRLGTVLDPELMLQVPASVARLIFATLASRRLSIWVKFPWQNPLQNSLLLIVSWRRDDGSHLNIGWSPQVRSRADAVDFLTQCPRVDAVWIGDEHSLMDQRHGNLVSIEHYTKGLSFISMEAMA